MITENNACSVCVPFAAYYNHVMQQTRYSAYLIRWQEDTASDQWRAFAENAYTGEKLCFTSKHMLVQFLWQSLNDEANAAVSILESNETE